MWCDIVKERKPVRKFRKRFGIQIEWKFGSKVLFITSSSSSSSLQSNWSLSMGSIQIETAYLFDNVRYGSRWIRIVIGLNCDEGFGFSQGFKIVRILKVQQQEAKDSAGWSSADWHGSDRWNQRVKLHCVLRFIRIVYFWFVIGL